MAGHGHIDVESLTTTVAAAGYQGDVEVEFFDADVWSAPGAGWIATPRTSRRPSGRRAVASTCIKTQTVWSSFGGS